MKLKVKNTLKQKISLFSFLIVATFGLLNSASIISASAASCQAPSPSYGSDTMTLSVPSATSYTMWVRMQVTSTSANSLLMQVGGNCYTVGGSSSIPLNSWTWVNYQNGSTSQVMQASLASGNNTVVIYGSQPSVSVDTILALGDSSCIPTGFGTNCTTGQPSTPPVQPGSGNGNTSPSGSTQVGNTTVPTTKNLPSTALNTYNNVLTPNDTSVQVSSPVTVDPTYVPNLTIKEVKYYLNNKLVYSTTKYPYSYYLNTNKLEAGSYKLVSDTIYTSGHSLDASETINVKHSFFKNFYIFIVNNLVTVILIIILIAIIGLFIFRYRSKIRPYISLVKNRLKKQKTPVEPNDPSEPTIIGPQT
jgi:hypothetical protein